MEKQNQTKHLSKILYNKRNREISQTLDENVIIKGIFSGEFLNKYSMLRSSIWFAIPLIVIIAVMYLLVNTLWGLTPFIITSVVVGIIYSILYFIKFQRMFYFLNWVLIRKKKIKKEVDNRKINVVDGQITMSNEIQKQKYLYLSMSTKSLLENKIYSTFNSINEALSQIKVEYKIICDKNGIFIQAKELEPIKKAFMDYPVFKVQEMSYSPTIDFNNTKTFDYEYRRFKANNKWYKWAFVNINKLQHSVNISDIQAQEGVEQVIVFSKPFTLDLKRRNAINENIKVLQQEMEKNNAVNGATAYNDLNHTLGVLTNLMDDKTAVSSSTMMIIYKAENKNLMKNLTLKYKLTNDREYFQAYSVIQGIVDGNIYESSSIFNEVSCYNLANLLLSTHQRVKTKRHNDMKLGWKENKDFYFNNIETDQEHANRNLIIIAASGGGKSYTMHRLVKYNNDNGVKCILIDPNNQIKNLANANDFDITTTKFNLMYLNKNENVEDKTNFLIDVFNLIITIPSETLRSTLQTSLKTFYAEYKDTPLNQTLPTFIERINDTELEKYFNQINIILNNNQKLGNVFDSQAGQLNLTGQNILFPVQQFTKVNQTSEDKVILLTMFYMIDNFIQEQFMLNNHTMIYIDEAHNFFKPEYLPYLLKLTKELRKFYSGIAFITQNFKDMFSNDVGDIPSKIFANCVHKMILKVEGSDLLVAGKNQLFGDLLTLEGEQSPRFTNKTLAEVINNLEVGQMVYFDNDIHYVDTVENWDLLRKNVEKQKEQIARGEEV